MYTTELKKMTPLRFKLRGSWREVECGWHYPRTASRESRRVGEEHEGLQPNNDTTGGGVRNDW